MQQVVDKQGNNFSHIRSVSFVLKVDLTLDSDPGLACMRQLYRTHNCGGASVRSMAVVPVCRQSVHDYSSGLTSPDPDAVLAAYLRLVEQHCLHLLTVPPLPDTPHLPPGVDGRRIRLMPGSRFHVEGEDRQEEGEEGEGQGGGELSPIVYNEQYYLDREEDFIHGRDDEDWLWEDEELCEDEYEFQWEYFTAKDVDEPGGREEVVVDETSETKEEVLNENDKLLVFTTGAKTYQAHQVGIKLMSKVKFKKKLNIPKDILQHAKLRQHRMEAEREQGLGRIDFEPTPWSNYREVAQMFDVVDVLIDFHGYVTGYGISPDSR
jgi:hypothetical protein